MRAQTSLPALGFALLLLTGVLVLGIAVADGALLDADRGALDRQAAVALSDRVVAADSPLTHRPNVLNRSAIDSLDGTALYTQLGLSREANATLRLDGRTLATTGSVTDGATLTRLVVVQSTVERTLSPQFTATNDVTVPRRTSRATIRIRPQPGTTVTAVRANDRVLLHNDSGLRGRFEVSLSPYRTTTLSFEADRLLAPGSVDITYYPTRTAKARLEVTVDG